MDLASPDGRIPNFFQVQFPLNLIYILAFIFYRAFLFFFESKNNTLSVLSIIVMSLAGGLIIDSDKLYMYIFIIPLILSSCIQYLLSREKKHLNLLAIGVLSVLTYKIDQNIPGRIFLYAAPGIKSPGIGVKIFLHRL